MGFDEMKVIEGNPGRRERIKSLMEGKILRVNYLEASGRVRYIRMNEYSQLEYSLTGKEETYQVFQNGYDYSPALEDINHYGIPKRVLVLEDCD